MRKPSVASAAGCRSSSSTISGRACSRRTSTTPALNPLYRDVLAHYGVVALPCRVGDPDRKGKVESAIGHAQAALKGLRFETLEAAQAYLDRWDARWADTLIHGTTKRQVAAMSPRSGLRSGRYPSSRFATTSSAPADYVTKPFDIDRLLSAVERVVRRRALGGEIFLISSEIGWLTVLHVIVERTLGTAISLSPERALKGLAGRLPRLIVVEGPPAAAGTVDVVRRLQGRYQECPFLVLAADRSAATRLGQSRLLPRAPSSSGRTMSMRSSDGSPQR